MARFVTAAQAAASAIAETVDLVAVDGLPEDKYERRALLRFLAGSDTWVPTHCPETGKELANLDIVAHAQGLWPHGLPSGAMSLEAHQREAALYRAAGKSAPVRR
jgi:hypothetical protein